MQQRSRALFLLLTALSSLAAELDHMPFTTLDDLPVPLQFLLSCGARPNLDTAKGALQKMIDGNCRAMPVALREPAQSTTPSFAGGAGNLPLPMAAVDPQATEGVGSEDYGEEEEEEEYDSNVDYDDTDEEVIFTPAAPAAPLPSTAEAAKVAVDAAEAVASANSAVTIAGSPANVVTAVAEMKV